MRILIVTPFKRGSRMGNQVTGLRWARLLRKQGHRVSISESYSGGKFDVLIALHARKSATAVFEFRRTLPDAKIVVVLTGTDIHGDLANRDVTESLREADKIVVLEPLGVKKLSASLRKKTHVIFQSANALKNMPRKLTRCFEVSVIGHLRPVKDPLRTALAARRLPQDSKVQVSHFGAALSAEMKRKAEKESKSNPRYHWFGSVTHGVAQRRLARSRVTVSTSKSEGGPAIFSEAIVNDVPILASRNDASQGVLGKRYPGLFPYGDTAELAVLISRCETDSRFYNRLKSAIAKLKPGFSPEVEAMNLRSLLWDVQFIT